jgi:sugar/nucleoside kinase (ribokinase family)
MDVIAHVDDAFLARHDIAKARMNMVDEERCRILYDALPASRVECSGGSAGNTIAGLRSLGAAAAFMGKVADDAVGAAYIADMRRIGAGFYGEPLVGGLATARSMIAVTPDGERSMNTYLGASTEFAAGDIDAQVIGSSQWLYLEGYLFDKPAAKTAFVRAAEIARASGRSVALTLSDVFCVERHRDSFLSLVREHVDLVFANEHELLALYQTSDFHAALTALRQQTRMAAVTRSEKGAVVSTADGLFEAAVDIAPVVDATGAGDQFAAGFLFGVSRSLPPLRCAQLGNICAREAISHIGPRPELSLFDLARQAGLI